MLRGFMTRTDAATLLLACRAGRALSVADLCSRPPAVRRVCRRPPASSGSIRRATLGEGLVPYSERVDRAVQKILQSQTRDDAQREWLLQLGKALEADVTVDREALAQRLGYFTEQARKSRLGLYQDVMRTKTVSKFRELVSGKVVSAVRSVETYGKGEILLTRMIEYRDQVFLFGDPKGWPAHARAQIEDMVLDKMLYFHEGVESELYPTFMKLAGPYWMSCVTTNEDTPILAPDHYLSYL
jgi:hypothetical protein